MEALLGVVVGFLLGLIPPWLAGKRRVKAHFGALRSEIEICRSFAQTYLDDNVQSPLYRLPTNAYSVSLAAVLSEGELIESESEAMTRFYALVMEFNRGLDNADHFHKSEQHKLRNSEYDRNRIKAERLTNSSPENEYVKVIEVIEGKS